MNLLKVKVSQRQQIALNLLNDPTVTRLTYGGAAGGGKSWLVGLWLAIECYKYPGIRVAIGRRELNKIMQTTYQTLVGEVHKVLGISDLDFTLNGYTHTLTYRNSSQIYFLELQRRPTDPDYNSLGSLNLTHCIVEEGGEVIDKAVAVLSSRTNRHMNKETGVPGKTIITCNPSQNFLRSTYDKFIEVGGGSHQVWQAGEVYLGDDPVPSYHAFIKSLPTDNPFLSKNYIANLMTLPEAERRRLLEGDWDYEDVPDQLITINDFNQALVDSYEDGMKYAGADIAREGNDKTVFSLINNQTLIDIRPIKVDISETSPILNKIGDQLINYINEHDVGYEHTQIDAVGLGAGVIDYCRGQSYFFKSYKAGRSAKPERNNVLEFDNQRSQDYWKLAQAIKTGDIKILRTLPNLIDLRNDLLAHRYSITDRLVKVESKQLMKKRIARSPDYADAFVIAYNQLIKPKPSISWL